MLTENTIHISADLVKQKNWIYVPNVAMLCSGKKEFMPNYSTRKSHKPSHLSFPSHCDGL